MFKFSPIYEENLIISKGGISVNGIVSYIQLYDNTIFKILFIDIESYTSIEHPLQYFSSYIIKQKNTNYLFL